MNIVKTEQDFKNLLLNILMDFSNKKCNLMISGGSLLNYMNDLSLEKLETKDWNVFFCDERFEEQHSNFKAASKFLKNIKGSVFPMSQKNFKESAVEYEEILKKYGPEMDVCLLGIGENGHICSLWPNSKELESEKLVEAVKVETPISPERITVTLKFINQFVKNLYFLIPSKNGKSKGIKEPDESIKNKIKIKYKTYYME